MKKIFNTSIEFGSIAKFLHWFMAVGIIGMIALGFIMVNIPDSAFKWNTLYMLHKSIGFTLLILLCVRFGWRLINIKPDLMGTKYYRILAKLSVWVLYSFTAAMLLSGFIMSDAGNHPINFFKLFNIPLILPANAFVASSAREMHTIAAYSLALIIPVHIAAAFYHHFILKDRVLLRMAPQRIEDKFFK